MKKHPFAVPKTVWKQFLYKGAHLYFSVVRFPEVVAVAFHGVIQRTNGMFFEAHVRTVRGTLPQYRHVEIHATC